MNYTKGQWKAHKNALGTWSISTELEPIGQIDRHFNAQLIAAATDMYEALKVICGLFDYDNSGFKGSSNDDYVKIHKDSGSMRYAFQALAKAETL